MNWLKRYLTGTITINEIRKIFGMAPLPKNAGNKVLTTVVGVDVSSKPDQTVYQPAYQNQFSDYVFVAVLVNSQYDWYSWIEHMVGDKIFNLFKNTTMPLQQLKYGKDSNGDPVIYVKIKNRSDCFGFLFAYFIDTRPITCLTVSGASVLKPDHLLTTVRMNLKAEE